MKALRLSSPSQLFTRRSRTKRRRLPKLLKEGSGLLVQPRAAQRGRDRLEKLRRLALLRLRERRGACGQPALEVQLDGRVDVAFLLLDLGSLLLLQENERTHLY